MTNKDLKNVCLFITILCTSVGASPLGGGNVKFLETSKVEANLNEAKLLHILKNQELNKLNEKRKLRIQINTEEEFNEFLTNTYEKEASEIWNKAVIADWDFSTDINNSSKQEILLQATLELGKFNKNYWTEIFKDLDVTNYKDETLKRQAKLLKVLGQAALDEKKLEELTTDINDMKNIYSTAKICPYKKQNCDIATEGLTLEPDIQNVLAESSDYDELKYVWEQWRDASGKKIKETYQNYVQLSNQAAVENGFADNGDMWKSFYESDTFENDIAILWNQVKPLYDELHTYVANKLKKHYGDKLDVEDGLIPAHILGNMWAQSWINIGHLVTPYPDATSVDVTAALIEKGYTALKMFEVSDDFYQSLGLEPNDMSYGDLAVIVKPEDREILCHASAWDFYDRQDFRIKMCTEVNYEDFITVHHEMGHIQYFILYKDQPIAFRNGANPGFHEAVGDTIALSVATPNHLQKINLLSSYNESKEADINNLMNMALERIAFLPFGYLIDKWRWDVFSGKVNFSEWNERWWHYRETIQKLKPPEQRSPDDFDPGAKYHVAGDSQYINYFIAHILEFQLYRSLCKTAKQYDPNNSSLPLYKCDFYQSKEVGQKLRNGLSLGVSKHWKDVLKEMTGETDLDATAILEYFDPLLKYLKEENLKHYLETTYEKEASQHTNDLVHAEWNFATDVANKTAEQEQLAVTLEVAKYNKDMWTNLFHDLNEDDYSDDELKRQINILKVVGNAALEEGKLSELSTAVSSMTNIYSTAKICPYSKQNCDLETEGLALEPDIESILVKSRDYDELIYVWSKWRDATGVKMKETYKKYVELSNEATVINGFKDKGELWQSDYESPNFVDDMDKMWMQVKPLYDELHKYVSLKLQKVYPEFDANDGLIPAHLFGNMWAQSWINLQDIVKPYPNATSVDVTGALVSQGYTVKKMFEASNEFYLSLGLESSEMSYGEKAVIEKPPAPREILCHASAWDFSDKEDFRIKMCTEVNYEDFITIHHEMGHIQYYLLYKDQPISFRDGANPGFHEAVGDTIALSVATPTHLQKIGLLTDYEESPETDINTLMDMALERVAFLPFGLLIDKWRWDVFANKIQPQQWNSHWWDYRKTYQKLKPPVDRNDNVDFDPGAKYHVAGDSQYINYFFAHILEFQLYRSLCKTAKQYDPNNSSLPLHKCDFYQSKEVGQKLRNGLSLGVSKHWKDVLKEMTGETDLDATAILEYFDPLLKYLKKENLKHYLETTYEKEASQHTNDLVHAEWNFATDVANKTAEEEQLRVTLEVAKYNKDMWTNLFHDLNEDDYSDDGLRRQISFLKVLGNAALEEDKLSELTTAVSHMTNIYSTAKICPYSKQNCNLETEGLALEPDIESILVQSRDYDELIYVWSKWRDATGVEMKETYKKYVDLSNEAAVINGFKDKGELWRSAYESPNFVDDMDRIWIQVKPLYDELHRYVSKKLQKTYSEFNATDGLIPAHLFGNMWAQSWINLQDIVKPYPDATSVDVTGALVSQGYTVKKMFETSNEFYLSLGLESSEMSYGEKAVIEKPPAPREILCHASAWDFSDKEDFRIKMCTEVNYEDFITIHHEMGHIEYFLLYKDQPISFRDGANPGFHEAVGDTIALSVATPTHLKKIGLLADDYDDSPEADINALMDMALERVAFLPFGLLIDKWRWDVFANNIEPSQWNSHWWQFRKTYQKLKPPVERNDTVDFDPGAKYHVAGDSQYINYFFAHILEFQLYKALCIKAGGYNESKPEELHKCDFYQSKEAGNALRIGLELGKSQHWKEALEKITGSRELDASALLEYFQPLFNYLIETNGPLTDETELSNFLKLDYEPSVSKSTYDSVVAEWNFITDVSNPEKEKEQIEASLRLSEFTQFYVNNYFKKLKESDYQSADIRRQLSKLKILGNAALSKDKYEEYVKTTAEMTNIYSKGRICPFENQNCNKETEGLTLEPGIETIMATSTDYSELLYAWNSWREVSGKLIRDKYKTYVKLSNEAAVANDFEDKGEMWRSAYESPTFIQDMDELWNKVKPLYDELHRFVARKLKERYQDEIDISDNLIPAHVLGNMWAQSWTNLFSLVKPYPKASDVSITEGLQKNNYTVLKMFETSDEFYMSLGLESNAMSYDTSLGAVIEKPTDRDILCHASAIDFSNGKDFRIKMCTEVNHEDFITVHHEMGHIQYFIQYKDQPKVFRDSANPGFHEAIGDAIALSVATPKHLLAIGLLENYENSAEASINALMEMALERVAFLPFGLLVDKWRWDVFNGKVNENEWNLLWWKYRQEYQGIKPPLPRTENDFDPGAKFHVPGDSQYINYFVARILQFQIYKALCKEAGEYSDDKTVPLHQCDFYKSTKAGDALKRGLSLGLSKHWSVALKEMTGEETLNADALLEYFEPLMQYLKAQNVGPSTPEEESSQTVPIVVGSVIGAALVGALSFYGYKKYKQNKS